MLSSLISIKTYEAIWDVFSGSDYQFTFYFCVTVFESWEMFKFQIKLEKLEVIF